MHLRPTVRVLPLLALALLVLSALCPAMAQDKWSAQDSTVQALAGLLDTCAMTMEDRGIGFAPGGMCVGVARVDPGGTATVGFGAEAGHTFTVYTAGDDATAGQIEVDVLNGDGEAIAGHDDDLGIAAFNNEDYTDYTIQVSVSEQAEATGHVAFAVLCDGGLRVQASTFGYAFGQLAAALGAAEAKLGGDVVIHTNGGFGIYGAILDPDAMGRATCVALEPSHHVMFAAGDKTIDKVQCFLADEGIEWYASSEGAGPVVYCDYGTEEELPVVPGVSNQTDKTGVVMWTVIESGAKG
jgi:hypothetical protein